MKWEATINPSVLIVEDELEVLEGLRDRLNEISDKKRRSLRLKKFDVDLARTVAEAERFFAKRNGASYDLLLLDLGIPSRKLSDPTRPENGQKLLEKAQREGSSKEVIVISAWTDIEDFVVPAFRSGVIDFVAKPYSANAILPRVIECWKRLLIKQSTRLLGEERIKDLVPYAEKGLARRLTTCFTSLIRTVSHTAEDLERYIYERYKLDRQRDGKDHLFTCLNSQEEDLTRIKREWLTVSAPLQPSESSRAELVETLVKQIHNELLPCLVVKNLTLDFVDNSASEILMFGNDVRAVLREILSGAAMTLKDFDPKAHTINVKVTKHDGQVKVGFRDHLKPIAAKIAEEINLGSSTSPMTPFGREWGLSVMQHVAMHGGGRLHIEPRSDGNIINYFIPTAQ